MFIIQSEEGKKEGVMLHILEMYFKATGFAQNVE